MKDNQISIKQSIGVTLLKAVFGVYVIIAIIVTGAQLVGNYYNEKEGIKRDLKQIQDSFQPVLTKSVWHMNDEQVHSSLMGIQKLPAVVGVIILDSHNRVQNFIGTVPLEYKNQVKSKVKTSEITVEPQFQSQGLIVHNFNLLNQTELMATVQLYSNNDIVMRRVQYNFITTLLNGIVKTVALWIIFIVFANKILTKPLSAMTEVTKKLDFDNLEQMKMEVGSKHQDELKVLEIAFNGMVDKLTNAYEKMEVRIQERTESLRENERQLRLITDNIPAWIAFVDKDQRYRFANRAYCEFFGCTLQTIVDKKVQDVLSARSLEKGMPNIHKVLAGHRVEYSTSITDTHGKTHYLDVAYVPHIVDGNVEGFFMLALDITDRKTLEQRLLQSQKLEALGTLAGGIAHDFNNILWAILGNTEMGLKKVNPEDKVTHHLEAIYKSGKRAVNLVRQILTFSRMDPAKYSSVDMVSIINEAIDILRKAIPTSIEFRATIPDNKIFVMADTTQIHQIILNLGSNAYHAMEETGGILEIKVTEHETAPILNQKEGPWIEISISDTGAGISYEDQDKIFDPFFTTKEVGKGTGLGLAVVQGIVKDHHGIILLDSEPGKGATFLIYFPVTHHEAKEEIVQKPEVKAHKGSGHILVVDDEQELIEIYLDLLEDAGFMVTTAENGSKALTRFQEAKVPVDLVITDQAMPIMTGKELCKELLAIQPNLPIILTTGYSAILSKEELKETGVSRYLIKPVDLDFLVELIKELIA